MPLFDFYLAKKWSKAFLKKNLLSLFFKEKFSFLKKIVPLTPRTPHNPQFYVLFFDLMPRWKYCTMKY